MDVNRTLAEATRRYLAATITLPELADISASHVHLLPTLPLESLAGRLLGAIEQGLAFMNDGGPRRMICGVSSGPSLQPR